MFGDGDDDYMFDDFLDGDDQNENENNNGGDDSSNKGVSILLLHDSCFILSVFCVTYK